MLPYSAEVLYALFGQYNQAIWPVPALFLILAAVIVALALRPVSQAGRAVGLVLAVAWIWTAIVFHWLHFLQINFAASGYAALFALQGLLLAWTLVLRGRVAFTLDRSPVALAALAVMICALFIYPALDWWAGHPWPQWRLFGTAPGPTMLFTLGVLLLARPQAPYHLLAIPVLWLVIDAWSAWVLGMTQDFIPATIALVAALGVLRQSRRSVEQ
jgi:hypothetical protein